MGRYPIESNFGYQIGEHPTNSRFEVILQIDQRFKELAESVIYFALKKLQDAK